jgi:hypothetical protein
MTENTSTSRVQLIRHEIKRRTLDVVSVEQISPPLAVIRCLILSVHRSMTT